MTAPVLTVTLGQPAADVLQSMRDLHVKHAVVVSGGKLVGILSERDLGGPSGGLLRRGRTVEDLMQHCATVAPPNMTVTDAAVLVRRKRIGCLPVVDGDDVVGIVTRGDLLEALALRRRTRESRPPRIIGETRLPHVASPNRDKWP